MPVNLASCLLKDFMYQQDEETGYIINAGKFVLVDRDEVADSILNNIGVIFDRYLNDNWKLHIEWDYDPFALNQALCRYSRDIFGEKRLHARFMHLHNKHNFSKAEIAELVKYEDYGLKVDSSNPYLHRRLSCLIYWFSVLKPFRPLVKPDIVMPENAYFVLEHHNEFMTYILVMMVLKCVNCRINVHENLAMFKQFLYDLHYRKLSRSALEFFLGNHIYNLNPKQDPSQ
jgi:hypothetical protein